MVRTVHLDEDEHAVNMLRSLKHGQGLCDFIITADGVEYQTHKIVLYLGSPYFKELLKHDMKVRRDGKVEMKDVDPECVKSCIDFLYSGKFDIPDGKIGQLLHVAIMLQLDKVQKNLSEILITSLNAENFYETKDMADVYDLQTVSKGCEAYYKENFMAISSQPGFQNEKKSDLIYILKSRNLKLTEEEKLKASLRLVRDNPSEKETLFELIKLINLKDVSSEYLSDILENDPVIGNDFRLYKLISASCIEKMKVVKKSDNNKDSYRNQIVLFDDDAHCLRSYDPATDEVTKFHDEKFNHLGNFTAVAMDSYIYVLCQNKSVHRLNILDKLAKWETIQDMVTDHGWCPPAVSLSGSLFVIGSYNEATKDVEKFDSDANRWLKLNDKPEAIESPTVVALNDSIFCIGGWDGCEAVNSFCRFTPSSLEWVDLEPLKDARYRCGAVAFEERIFVMGGWRSRKPMTEVECYDVTSRQWSSLSPTINPHGGNVVHHINEWIFLVDRCENWSKVEKYNIADDGWCRVEFKEAEQFDIYDSVSIQI